ncbi:MAG: ACT domain-containing protein [Oscillospiraceae bacterium]|nr:ACT domain-containing protein [Oscillospiraceae bacterium]
MSIKQISVFVENRPGSLNAMTEVLAQNDIDLRALSLAETEDFGIVRLIVDNAYKATTVLKDAGYVHSATPVVGVVIPDVPGGLNQVLQVLTAANVNIEYMYAFLGGKKANHAYMIFRVEDTNAASAALVSKGIQTVDQEDIEEL